MQGGIAFAIQRVYFSALIQQQGDDIRVIFFGGDGERQKAFFIGQIGISPGAKVLLVSSRLPSSAA